MTWTRLSDDTFDVPAMLTISRSARLLHIEALIWCNRILTDGVLPAGALPRLTDSPDLDADVSELVRVGLWEVTEAGWQIDWTNQEAASDVRARQAHAADKQKRYRDRKDRHNRGDHSACDPRFCKDVTGNVTGNATRHVTSLVTPSRPVPSRPVPSEGQGQGQASDGRAYGAPPTTGDDTTRASHQWHDDGSGITCEACGLPHTNAIHEAAS